MLCLASACQAPGHFEASAPETDLATLQQRRLAEPAVREVLEGSLLFLDDTQIRDRPGRRSSYFDWCGDRDVTGRVGAESESARPGTGDNEPLVVETDEGDKHCRSRVFVSLPISQRMLGIHAFDLDVRNEVGEWATLLGVVPAVPGNRNERLFAAIQDSTMFVTAAVGYPLFLLDAPRQGVIAEILQLARDNIARYRRNHAYNFWLQRPAITGREKDHQVVFPNNIPVAVVEKYARLYVEDPNQLAPLTQKITQDQRDRLMRWTRALLDEKLNPHGADAAFNIPNDADDTSTAVAFGILYRNRDGLPHAGETPIDDSALSELPRFRDLKRHKEDGHDAWKGIDSGAFLTWLKDEDEPPFDRPDQGVIPRAVNNVDCVVNANALLALGLAGRADTPGYDDALRLMVRAVERKAWPECGVYYPQRMIFPYALSRAWRDGGATTPALETALGTLMRDLLQQQSTEGSLDGGFDRSRDLSTALAVVTLLNLGERTALAAGVPLAEYSAAIHAGLDYLYRQRHRVPLKNSDSFARGPLGPGAHDAALTWEPGVFFASAFWDLVQWRSEAYTTAIVLEAFARYALGYDKHSAGILDGPRIAVDERRFGLRIANPAPRATAP